MNARATENHHRIRGFTLVETVLVAVLVPIVLSAGFLSIKSSGSVQRTVQDNATNLNKVRSTLRRMADELRMSSQTGEDDNGNATLDAGEDRNGNGRLESDWASTDTSITFNRILPDGSFSLPITYAKQDDRLVRTRLTSEGPEAVTIAQPVQSFAVVVADDQVDISLSVGWGPHPHSTRITVIQRN